MPRQPRPWWDKREGCYRTGVGGRIKYFRGIARDDHVGIANAYTAYLNEIDAERNPQPDVLDLCIAFVQVNGTQHGIKAPVGQRPAPYINAVSVATGRALQIAAIQGINDRVVSGMDTPLWSIDDQLGGVN